MNKWCQRVLWQKKKKIQTQPKKVPKLKEFVKVDSENDDKEDEPLLEKHQPPQSLLKWTKGLETQAFRVP